MLACMKLWQGPSPFSTQSTRRLDSSHEGTSIFTCMPAEAKHTPSTWHRVHVLDLLDRYILDLQDCAKGKGYYHGSKSMLHCWVCS